MNCMPQANVYSFRHGVIHLPKFIEVCDGVRLSKVIFLTLHVHLT